MYGMNTQQKLLNTFDDRALLNNYLVERAIVVVVLVIDWEFHVDSVGVASQ